MLANGGKTQPRLLKTIISSSDFLLSQYAYDDPTPEVYSCFHFWKGLISSELFLQLATVFLGR
jgi:hypothetical protein